MSVYVIHLTDGTSHTITASRFRTNGLFTVFYNTRGQQVGAFPAARIVRIETPGE